MQIITKDNQEWLKKREEMSIKGAIGASEIYSAVYHYCYDDIKRILNIEYPELPFFDAHKLYKIKKGLTKNNIKDTYVIKGREAEKKIPIYLKDHLGIENFKMNPENTIEYNEEKYPYLFCTPDGYIDEIDIEIDGKVINKTIGKGLIECKHTNEFSYKTKFNFDCPLKYVFQLQLQMLITERNWGMICVRCEDETKKEENFEVFLYKKSSLLQNLIIKASEQFKNDFDNEKCPEPIPLKKYLDDAIALIKEEVKKEYDNEDFDNEVDISYNNDIINIIEKKENIDEQIAHLEKQKSFYLREIAEKTKNQKITIANNKLIEWSLQHRKSFEIKEQDYVLFNIKNNNN